MGAVEASLRYADLFSAAAPLVGWTPARGSVPRLPFLTNVTNQNQIL
jgi:hypothetical protein